MNSAIDAGNHVTKFYDGNQCVQFPSVIGEYRERNIRQKHGDYDFEWEYNGARGFAGTLAMYESECAESHKGETKAHPDAVLRILLALHQYSRHTEHKVVVGQPISGHNQAQKDAIKQMLQGRHDLTVNGQRRVIVIQRCEVAAEGVTAGLLVPGGGLVRIIDIGSGTVNFGTLLDRRFVDKGSFTLATGLETLRGVQQVDFARQIALRALAGGWRATDAVYVCGGGAQGLLPYLNAYFKAAALITGDPSTANARAFYLIAGKLYA